MSAVAKNEILSSLAVMGYDERYIERAVKIHSKSKFGTNYNLSLLVEIIDRLKQKDALKNNNNNNHHNNYNNLQNNGAFCAHFASADELLSYLNFADLIDYRFDNGRYVLCKIIEKDLFNEYKILLHPASQPLGVTKHNKYCYIYTEFMNLAIQKSVTLRKLTSRSHALYNIGIDARIDINPIGHNHNSGWKHGQIIKLDGDSSQVKVAYYAKNKNHCYWIHLENEKEAAPFNTKYNPLKHDMMANFNEFAGGDNSALKRFTSIDVIANRNDEQVNKMDLIKQLTNFGYSKPLIVAAMAQTDKTDMNCIIEVIERIKAEEQKKNADFDNHLSSMMVGNDLMMDDIIDQMECGDDGNNDDDAYDDDGNNLQATPMGPATPNGGGLPPPNDPDDGNEAPIAFAPPNMNPPPQQKYQNPLLMDAAPEGGRGDMMEGGLALNMNNNNENQNQNKKDNHRKRSQSKAKKLWKSGKKVFGKKKGNNHQNNNKKKNSNAIFGVAPAHLECTNVKEYVMAIPNVLIALKHHLFVNSGHLVEGIFRIAPNGDACKAIEDELNDGKLNSIEFVNVKPDILANLIKLWFRRLPDALLQNIAMNKIEKCHNVQQVDGILRNDICEPNATYFLWLLDLCCEIVQHVSANKMGIKAMSVVIAPNLYDPSKIDNAKLMSFSADMIKFVHLAIEWRQRNK